MHAALGIGAAKNTIVVYIQLGNRTATSLVDIDSTSTFVSPKLVARMNNPPTHVPKTKVLVADVAVRIALSLLVGYPKWKVRCSTTTVSLSEDAKVEYRTSRTQERQVGGKVNNGAVHNRGC